MIGTATIFCVAAWGPSVAPRRTAQQLSGWQLYDKLCLACHGAAGDGKGPAATYTRGLPRDFTKGAYAWRSTPSGQGPTREDVRATLRHGAPGTSMPGFALTDAQLDQLIDVVDTFAPIAFGTPIKLAPSREQKPGAALWAKYGCTSCHGNGDGNTPAAKAMATPPYDLTREPLRRPRASDTRDARRAAAAMSIATGISGTPMPGYHGTIPDDEIWALADHVVAINAPAKLERSAMDARAIERDLEARTEAGTWLGNDPDEAALFGGPIALQGTPPPTLAPAQTSLRANQCARCHNKQFREWDTSLHRGATSPGLAAQMWGMSRVEAASCSRCHAPLPEQQDDKTLHGDGVLCAGCHVRGWTRHGPPNLAPSLIPQAGYPLKTLAIYERADFCAPCHQLPTRAEVAGRPLLNTYKEWLEGPYMKRGIQCQHCHMPNREHSFKGIHDPQTFREGVAVTARASAKDGVVNVVAEVANIGAGHYLPTTPTPAAWLTIELLDGQGKALTAAKQRIGRDIYFDGEWHEKADTRIPPGEKLTFARAWKTTAAVTARITLEVHPDDYYERLYTTQLAMKLPAERRKLYEQALARGRSRRYVAEQRDVPILAAPRGGAHDGRP
jgi:Cytochrome C oxidase, cbb3-type, subunit III/Cytochrome c554 and c-prime